MWIKQHGVSELFLQKTFCVLQLSMTVNIIIIAIVMATIVTFTTSPLWP
jgi:hypothetical protein